MSGTRPSSQVVHSVVNPPSVLLYASIGCVIVSALLIIPVTMTASILGYLLTPIASTVLTSVYRAQDIRRQQSVWYLPSEPQRKLVTTALIVSFVVGAVHAWVIATEIAKSVAA
jgi:hypothetical protein